MAQHSTPRPDWARPHPKNAAELAAQGGELVDAVIGTDAFGPQLVLFPWPEEDIPRDPNP